MKHTPPLSRFLFVALCAWGLVSCQQKGSENDRSPQQAKEYDMYESSEMADYMNAIYRLNEEVKADILSGKTPAEFPREFLEIHTAEMSDFKGRNPTFESLSHLFVERMEWVFDTTATTPVERRFNDAINLCIACHQTECTGPIPRIKKLLIQ